MGGMDRTKKTLHATGMPVKQGVVVKHDKDERIVAVGA